MWGETFVWWIFTVFVAYLLVFIKSRQLENRAYKRQVEELKKIKSHHIKTLSEQKRYIKGRADMGQDFIIMIGSIMIFFVGFYLAIYPLIHILESFLHITPLFIGIVIAPILALIFAYIYARYLQSRTFFRQNLIDTFLTYSYSGLFIVYIRSVQTIYPLLVLIGSILIMYFITIRGGGVKWLLPSK